MRHLLGKREMRITGTCLILACGLMGSPHLVRAQVKYGVVVQTVKPEALANARTYVWTVTRPSFDKTIDSQIIAAVDRELSARGLTKRPSGPSDVSVTYASVSRTDIDLKTSPKDGAPNESAVGTLTVDVSNPTTRELLYRVRVDTPIEKSSTALESVINASVKAMFEKYPSSSKR